MNYEQTRVKNFTVLPMTRSRYEKVRTKKGVKNAIEKPKKKQKNKKKMFV